MWDLLLGIAGVSGAAVCLFFASIRAAQRQSRTVRNVVAVAASLLGAAYFRLLWNQVLLSKVVPVSAMIVLGNWFPLFAAVLCGLAWRSPISLPRRFFSVTALGLSALFMLVYPVLGRPPQCGDQWQGEVCMQTTPHTCSAASAATLLHKYGIEASESEMAMLCLTREGTSWQGLYRGLSLKTENSPWQVEVVDGSFNDLQSGDFGPAILFAELPSDAGPDSPYAKSAGWVPGRSHSVVFSRFLDERTVVIDDPSFGHEIWRVGDLETLWTGRAVRLVPRDRDSMLVGFLRAGL